MFHFFFLLSERSVCRGKSLDSRHTRFSYIYYQAPTGEVKVAMGLCFGEYSRVSKIEEPKNDYLHFRDRGPSCTI